VFHGLKDVGFAGLKFAQGKVNFASIKTGQGYPDMKPRARVFQLSLIAVSLISAFGLAGTASAQQPAPRPSVTDPYPNRLTAATPPNTVLPDSHSSPFGFNGRFADLKAGYSG